jgi:FkbM family methyltransferase
MATDTPIDAAQTPPSPARPRRSAKEKQAFRQERLKTARREGRARGIKLGRAEGVLATLSRFLGPQDLVYDCGANLGEVSGLLAPSGAQIIAYEPDPYCVNRLQTRFAGVENVQIRAEAVGTAPAQLPFYRHRKFGKSDYETQAGTLVTGNANVDYDSPAVMVPQIDLIAELERAIADHGRISVLKLDIEGAELDIIEAMLDRNLFDHIRMALVETHEQQFPDLAERSLALKARIAARYAPEHVNTEWI